MDRMNSNDVKVNEQFVDNIWFLIMFRNVILRNPELSSCLVRQPGFIDGSLEAYLNFWFECLPASTDRECRPICAVSPDGFCISDSEHRLVKAELNVPVEEVVKAFEECVQRSSPAQDSLSVYQVIQKLYAAMDNVDRFDLVGYQQYYLPAKESILSLNPDLTPVADKPLAIKLHQERARYDKELDRLRDELREAHNRLFHTSQRLRVELVKSHRVEYDAFYSELMNLKSMEQTMSSEHRLQRHNLLKQLRNGVIDNSTYRKLLHQSSDQLGQLREKVEAFYAEGIERIFGEDKSIFSINNLPK